MAKEKEKKKADKQEKTTKRKFSLDSLAFWKKSKRRHEPDLNKVWLYLIGAFGVVAIIVVVFHVVLYLRIDRDEIFTGEDRETPTIETIDRTELNDVLSFFENREARFRSLRVSRPNTIDPAF